MAAVTIYSDFGAEENKVCHCFHCLPIYLPWCDGLDAMILVFWMLSFKSIFSLSSFTFIKRLFSSSLPAIRVVSSAYLRLSGSDEDVRMREMFRWGSFWSSRNAHSFKFFFLTEKQIHAILTHRNKMCVLKVKDLPQILPYNELLLTTGFILSTWIEEGAGR